MEDTRDRTICTSCNEETDRSTPCCNCGARDPEAAEIPCPECMGAKQVARWTSGWLLEQGWTECTNCMDSGRPGWIEAPYVMEAEEFAAEWALAEAHMEARANPECRSCGCRLSIEAPRICFGQRSSYPLFDAPLCGYCLISSRELEAGRAASFGRWPYMAPYYVALSPFAIAAMEAGK